MLLGALMGVFGLSACTFSGAFGATGSTTTITGTARTVTVPGGNSGVLNVAESVIGAGGTLEHQINSGGWSAAAVPALSNGQTLQFRMTGLAIGDGSTVSLTDATTGLPVTSFTLQRTS